MPSKVFSAAIQGLDARIIEVETDVSYGLRCFNIVGLADKAVEESKERTGAAIKSSNFNSPHRQPQRVLVNLAPADIKKEGSLYDLPIALGYLLASGQIKFNPVKKIFAGELALDGALRHIRGVMPLAVAAQEKGFEEMILPLANAQEAALAVGFNKSAAQKPLKIIGVGSLKEAISYLEGRISVNAFDANINDFLKAPKSQFDLGLIRGQESAKRALEIAAAGGHNLLMQGPPGAGKSILARALPSILPDLSLEEIIEITRIYSVAGLLPEESPIVNIRPFRSPHHTTSEAALIGGGNPPRPGEITLSHRGILFLDEFPEFHRDVLESLRQPIEEGVISILRARQGLTFPARFTLIAAANPCPCGYYKDPNRICHCTSSQISSYRRKLSGPLIDRIDLFIDVPPVKFEKLAFSGKSDFSAATKTKVEEARQIQKTRFLKENKIETEKVFLNSEMRLQDINNYCPIDNRSRELARRFVDSGRLSARGYHRVLKVARTIADLDASEKIEHRHFSEALLYRTKEN